MNLAFCQVQVLQLCAVTMLLPLILQNIGDWHSENAFDVLIIIMKHTFLCVAAHGFADDLYARVAQLVEAEVEDSQVLSL